MSRRAFDRPMRASLVALFLVAVPPWMAHAQDDRLALEWDAPAGCVTAEQLARAVEQIRAEPTFAEDGRASIRGRVVAEGSAHVASLALVVDGAIVGTREVRQAGACAALLGPLSVVVALLVDVRREHVPLVLPEPPAPPPAPEAPATETPPTAAFTLHAAIEGVLLVGLLPNASIGPALRAGLTPRGGPALRLGLVSLPELADTAVGSFFATWGSLEVCPTLLDGELALRVCAAVDLGVLRGVGRNAARVRESFVPIVAPGASVEFVARLSGPIGLRVSLGAAVPVVSPYFFYEAPSGVAVVHQPWPVWLRASIGLSLDS